MVSIHQRAVECRTRRAQRPATDSVGPRADLEELDRRRQGADHERRSIYVFARRNLRFPFWKFSMARTVI